MTAALPLEGKNVIVTGASRGIGLAVAKAFVDCGARVGGCGRSLEPWPLLDMYLTKVQWLRVDVGQEDEVKGLAQEIKKMWGHVDVLVNNAGVLGPLLSLVDYPEKEWAEVLQTNLTGPFLMVKHFSPIMPPGASIINVSSGFGRFGRANAGAYGVSKFALEGFSQILSEDLFGRGIRVNVVDPGAARTSMRAAVKPEEDPMTISHPESLTSVFVFLASDASRGITKQRFEAQRFVQ